MAVFLHELSSKEGSSLLGLLRAAHHLEPVNGHFWSLLAFLLLFLFLFRWSLLHDLFDIHDVAEAQS